MIRPSLQAISLFRVLATAPGRMTAAHTMAFTGMKDRTTRNTLTRWHKLGLVERDLIGNEYYYRWGPNEAAKALSEMFAASAGVAESIPERLASTAPAVYMTDDKMLARELRDLARTVELLAQKIERRGGSS